MLLTLSNQMVEYQLKNLTNMRGKKVLARIETSLVLKSKDLQKFPVKMKKH